MTGFGAVIGGGLASVFLALAFWIALGERALRRQRLRSASNLYRLRALSAIDFEEAASELFRLQGYVVVENKRPDDEDGGVDLELARGGETFLVQVKHKWDEVSVKDVRELWGLVAAEGAEGGVFVTASRFSVRAVEFAEGKRLELIDGEAFLRLRAELLPTAGVVADHDPVVAEGFASYLAGLNAPACRKCGKKTVLVTKLTGASVTDQFWGCADYPTCQSRRPVSPYLGEVAGQADSKLPGLGARLEIALTNRLRLRRSEASRRPS
jgi:restriction system protein